MNGSLPPSKPPALTLKEKWVVNKIEVKIMYYTIYVHLYINFKGYVLVFFIIESFKVKLNILKKRM